MHHQRPITNHSNKHLPCGRTDIMGLSQSKWPMFLLWWEICARTHWGLLQETQTISQCIVLNDLGRELSDDVLNELVVEDQLHEEFCQLSLNALFSEDHTSCLKLLHWHGGTRDATLWCHLRMWLAPSTQSYGMWLEEQDSKVFWTRQNH